MSWLKRNLRGTTVFAKGRPDGSLAVDGQGRVDIKYKTDDDAKIYRALARNLEAASEGAPAPPAPAGEAIIVYTDGACTGNPGPMGIGVVILDDGHRREVGDHIGKGTNNIAELTAIERALDLLAGARERPIRLHVDSSYAIGVVTGNFKAKANLALVERIREKARRFTRLRFVKVEGHAGVPENERADQLATEAIKKR